MPGGQALRGVASGEAVITLFLEYLRAHERFREGLRRLRPGATLYAPSFYAPYVLAGAIAELPAAWLVVAPDGAAATRLAGDLAVFLGREVAVLPARGVLWGGHVAPAAHICGQRQQALIALQEGGVVVAEAAALLERFPPLSFQPPPLELAVGRELPFERVAERLTGLGYARVGQVRGRGEFAVRGGLVDLYPSTGDPLRAEFWGDEVESLRHFSVFSQRTVAPVGCSTVHAACEVGTERQDYQRALERALGGNLDVDPDEPIDELYRRAAARAAEALSAQFVTVADLVATDGGWDDEATSQPPHRLAVLAPDDAWRALMDFAAEAEAALASPAECERFYLPPATARRWLSEALQVDLVQRDQRLQFPAARPQAAARDINAAERELARLVGDGYRTFVVFRHGGEAARAAYRLKSISATVLDVPTTATPAGTVTEPAPDRSALVRRPMPTRPPQEPGLYFVAAPLREGFVSAELKLAVIGERALMRATPREPRFLPGARLASFFDLRAGDFVVHVDHGIARFQGIETKTIAGVTRDYLFLQFKGEDKVFLPHDQIGRVSRYIGAGGAPPALNRLGGTAWLAVKTRARRAVVEMAGELLNLYAARQAAPGFAFAPDGELLARLEDTFPYEETDDQAEAIDEIKNDMEAAYPMDRLVCGDVGYGKTEVALRAAFKAAEAGKQTLMLVPTTILAQQHFTTFGQRFAPLPVRVEMASRFRTPVETRAILRDFRAGKVDVLIGTHRLLSRDVMPGDLGLVIVDEEQRFGVRQKELLRRLKLQVDVMSLSATPIPRTLQMSLTGIRDISVIETPPRGRHEIRTYIGEYRDEIVRVAIEKELARGGQAFYLHNRVETIDEAAEQVRQLVPAARVAVAHGQMHEHDLESVMAAFLAGEADVLVTTSIIESGIDIPTVNTLIVERADLLGLAQLYQIRGRIGRSDEYAYAYLLYPSEELLGGDAVARLQTLSDHTELGAGFKIAMRDLEIRGAGNMLGDEQSGHVAAVGFEMYAQLLEQAVAELRGMPPVEERPVRVEIPVTAYVPPEYIAYEATKIDVHRRMARVRDLRELQSVRAELGDRFGEPPEPVASLLALQAVRIKAAELGAAAVVYRGGRLAVEGLELDDAWAARLRAAHDRVAYLKRRAALAAHPPAEPATADEQAPGRGLAGATLLAWVEGVLDAILEARSSDAAIPERGL